MENTALTEEWEVLIRYERMRHSLSANGISMTIDRSTGHLVLSHKSWGGEEKIYESLDLVQAFLFGMETSMALCRG